MLSREIVIRNEDNQNFNISVYVSVRNDRTHLGRNVTEAQDEIADLKGKLRVLTHQFDQLKEEIIAKETALLKENQQQQALQKEKDDLVMEVKRTEKEAKMIKKQADETEKNYQKLNERNRVRSAFFY